MIFFLNWILLLCFWVLKTSDTDFLLICLLLSDKLDTATRLQARNKIFEIWQVGLSLRLKMFYSLHCVVDVFSIQYPNPVQFSMCHVCLESLTIHFWVRIWRSKDRYFQNWLCFWWLWIFRLLSDNWTVDFGMNLMSQWTFCEK